MSDSDRLTRLEVQMAYQTEILEDLRGLPKTCAARGVQLDTLVDAELKSRVQDLEKDAGYIKKALGVFIIGGISLFTKEWWGPVITDFIQKVIA